MASKRVVKCVDTPDHTLKLGWGDAGEGASLQVGGPRGAGELGIVYVGLVRDTAVNGVTSHRSVPLPRTARQHHFLLQKKQSSIRLPKRALIHRCATTATRSDPSFRIGELSNISPPPVCLFSPLWTMNHEALTCSRGDMWGVRAANVPWSNNPATVHVTLSGWSQTQSTLRKKGKSLQETLKPLELSCSQLCALQFPLLKDQVLLQLLSESSSVNCFSLNVPISSWLSPQTPLKSYNLIYKS